MVSHDHPRFSDPSYLPFTGGFATTERDTYDSTIVADERIYCQFTCSECGTEAVEFKGHVCPTCRDRILDMTIATYSADDPCPACGWNGCNDCLNNIAPGGAMGSLEVASGN